MDGWHHPFRSPRGGLVGAWQNRIANSEALRSVRRACLGKLPFPRMRSDVEDVVYANWVVRTDRIADIVPPRIRLVERDGHTPLTILSYRHRHFGPMLAGPLRRFFPSPLQSNWRLYVESIDGDPVRQPTVLFVRNIFDSALYALTTRLMSDSLPSHLAARFSHVEKAGCYETRIEGGEGSAPSFRLSARVSGAGADTEILGRFADDMDALLGFLGLQEAAVVPLGDGQTLARAEIALPVDLATILPLEVLDHRPGDLLERLGCEGAPFCFAVPRVRFDVLSEHLLPPPLSPTALPMA